MYKDILEKYLAIRAKVVEAVQFVEREFAGKPGPEKRKAAIRLLDGFIKLPIYLEWADDIIIGWLIDRAVEKLNWLTDFRFGKEPMSEEIDADKVAAVLTASHTEMESMRKSVPPDADVNERINALFEMYGIKPDESEGKSVTPAGAPAQSATSDARQKIWERAVRFVKIAEGRRNFDIVSGKPVLKASAKNDRGGPTAYGITRAALNTAYAGRIVGHNDICKLTQDEAKRIYKANYWDCYGWGELAWPVCLVLFDITVNHGMGGTATITQRACNTYGHQPALLVDGKWGPKTRAAVWSIAEKDPAELARLLLVKRREYYDAIIAKDKSQEVYRKGWYNRIRNLARESGVACPV